MFFFFFPPLYDCISRLVLSKTLVTFFKMCRKKREEQKREGEREGGREKERKGGRKQRKYTKC